MLIYNCKLIFTNRIEEGSIRIQDGKITEINPVDCYNEEKIDAEGLYLSPGFIDVHIHGAGGYDTMDGNENSLFSIAKTIARNGTTSFLPTTMTVSSKEINTALKAIKSAKKKQSDGTNILGAHILGAHLEGPFISPKAIGAQNPNFLSLPSISAYEEMVGDCGDIVSCITLAPELDGARELIEELTSRGIVCSMGHTTATYEEATEAIRWGVSHSTHLFNAQTPFTHRAPGVVGAIFDSDITTETISDGIHISYPALRVTYKVKGTDKTLLISDAMMACCMPDGTYSLGGQEVVVANGAARVPSGSLAGSVLTLDRAVYNVYSNTNIPLYEVVKMATLNGARHCNMAHVKGCIEVGYDADIILFDEKIQVKGVWLMGKRFV